MNPADPSCLPGAHVPVAVERPEHSIGAWWGLAKAAAAWVADYAPSMGAALSYYSVFSLAPLLLVVISIAGLVFGQDAVREPAQGIASALIGMVVMLVGATTVFGDLQDALDRIWRAPVRDRSGGLWALLRARPGRVGQALGIDRSFNGLALDQPPFELLRPTDPVDLIVGVHIGITKAAHIPWRFGVAGSPILSRRFS